MTRVYTSACVVLIAAALHGCQATGPDERSKAPEPPPAPARAVDTAPVEPAVAPEPPPPPAAASAPQPAQAAPTMDLKTAQGLLNKRGYKVGAPDGKMGPRTRQGLRRFQTEQRIPVTGNLDRETIERLMTK
ncbi:MAG TPA: peptidoglycan-binding domain-containing protein [Bryobacteraceae bacterium]|nr:peptidoglycan-binding domain-containing protein [Bryobacteraceae bacterium]